MNRWLPAVALVLGAWAAPAAAQQEEIPTQPPGISKPDGDAYSILVVAAALVLIIENQTEATLSLIQTLDSRAGKGSETSEDRPPIRRTIRRAVRRAKEHLASMVQRLRDQIANWHERRPLSSGSPEDEAVEEAESAVLAAYAVAGAALDAAAEEDDDEEDSDNDP